MVTVEGHCAGIPAGTLSITLYLELCDWSPDTNRNAHTGGYNTVNRIIIEEFRVGADIHGGKNQTDLFCVYNFLVPIILFFINLF